MFSLAPNLILGALTVHYGMTVENKRGAIGAQWA